MNTRNKKKIMMAVLAMVMICTVAVMGTIAYLTKTTAEVTNTFVAAGGGNIINPPTEPIDPDNPLNNNGFYLYEHKATKNADGTYKLATGSTKTDLQVENSYDVLPGVSIPKDPFISIKGLATGVNAYVFVELKDSLGASLSYEVDTTKWTLLSGVTGKNGGKVYSYKSAPISADLASAPVLKGNTMTVKDTGNTADYEGSLKLYGYICQSTGFATPEAAYKACFPNS